jgi:hypothetical protein
MVVSSHFSKQKLIVECEEKYFHTDLIDDFRDLKGNKDNRYPEIKERQLRELDEFLKRTTKVDE